MRKSETVVIEADGRDRGKTFLITEMPARQAEKWADRAFLALASSAVDLPAGLGRAGMSGIAQVAHLLGGMKFAEIDPLMDELLGCALFVPDPARRDPAGQPYMRKLVDGGSEGDDIEEVATRQYLRSRILALHVNFSLAAVTLNLMAAASELRTIPLSESTSTSRRRSGRSSRAA